MTTLSSILAWRMPYTEEPGGLQSTEFQSQTQLKRLSTRTQDDDGEHFNQGKSLDKYPAWQPTSVCPAVTSTERPPQQRTVQADLFNSQDAEEMKQGSTSGEIIDETVASALLS